MTAITKNLPWFIHDLGVLIVGEKCYTSLVENLNIADIECFKYSLSKGLGIGIVIGGSIMKLPQVFIILKGRSARGLSLPAYWIETAAYAINTIYSFRNEYPFSTYGENFFLTLQNVLITLLIMAYTPRVVNRSPKMTVSFLVMCAGAFALDRVSMGTLQFLQLLALPLSLFSKLPQIVQNYSSGSTGQLSAFTVVAQVAGCLARAYTTHMEVADNLVMIGVVLALVLNVVLAVQLWMYWVVDDVKDLEGDMSEKRREAPVYETAYEPAAWQQNMSSRSSTPPPYAASPSRGKQWARKVD